MNLNSLKPNRLPTSTDFTESALNRALSRFSFGHWSFRYSFPILLGIGVYGLLFGYSYNLFLLTLGVIGFAISYLIYNQTIRAGKFKREYTNLLLRALEEKTEQKLATSRSLVEHGLEHCASQLEQFKQKFEILVDILKTKFDPDQLTYSRYYSIAKEVFLSGIDNLTDILIAQKTLNAIDVEYINQRLKEIGSKDQTSMATQKELDALKRSLASMDQQTAKINLLVAQNETALAQLDEASIAISNISKSKDKEAQIDMENSMKALAELAQRTVLYSR
jgi:hypothetical protein